jgi:hypothetical protein
MSVTVQPFHAENRSVRVSVVRDLENENKADVKITSPIWEPILLKVHVTRPDLTGPDSEATKKELAEYWEKKQMFGDMLKWLESWSEYIDYGLRLEAKPKKLRYTIDLEEAAGIFKEPDSHEFSFIESSAGKETLTAKFYAYRNGAKDNGFWVDVTLGISDEAPKTLGDALSIPRKH